MARSFTRFSMHCLTLVFACTLLAGCNRGPQGVRFTTDGTTSSSGNNQSAEPIRALGAGEVRAAIAGKTFQYTRADGNGFVTYNADGSLSFQDDVKGEGSGRWSYQNGQYCETFGATAVQECGEFRTTGDAYFAAKSRLVEMKI